MTKYEVWSYLLEKSSMENFITLFNFIFAQRLVLIKESGNNHFVESEPLKKQPFF